MSCVVTKRIRLGIQLVSLLRSALEEAGEAQISEKHGADLLLPCVEMGQLRWIRHLLGCLLHISLGRC